MGRTEYLRREMEFWEVQEIKGVIVELWDQQGIMGRKGIMGSEMELWEARNYGNGAVSWGRSGIVGDTGIVGKMMARIAGEL